MIVLSRWMLSQLKERLGKLFVSSISMVCLQAMILQTKSAISGRPQETVTYQELSWSMWWWTWARRWQRKSVSVWLRSISSHITDGALFLPNQEADRDGDGQINYEEFCSMMNRYLTPISKRGNQVFDDVWCHNPTSVRAPTARSTGLGPNRVPRVRNIRPQVMSKEPDDCT